MREIKRGDVPKVLEQRLLITGDDREFLKTIEDMSPRDTGNIYVMGNPLNLPVPDISMLSKKLEKSEAQILKQAKDIAKKWGIPNKENLPTGNGIWDKDHALIHALGNQHKLRWDEKFNDYKVPRVHMFNALMSTGTLIANNDAFEGEKIVRQAMGIDNMLNSYNVQDGIMPEIIEIFGKAKNQRALMTGLNKTGKPVEFEEIEAIKKTLEIEDHDLSNKDWRNLEKYVVNTIDSFEEAAKSVAHELAPMYKNIPDHTDIHWYFGASDFANMKEIESSLIAQRRITNREMKKANEDLPTWRDDLDEMKQQNAKTLVNKLLSDKIYLHVNAQRRNFDEGNPFPEKGKEFGEVVASYFKTKTNKPAKRVNQLKNSIKKNYAKTLGKTSEMFDSIFDTAIIEYQELGTFKQIKDYKDKQTIELEKKAMKMSTLEDKIHEAERFENALIQEETQGPSWFTGHIAIQPTDAKVLQMVKKEKYKAFYEKILIPELKRITGKDHRIHLHTDKLISVHVPDPEHQINWENMTEEERANVPIGTIMTSFPQTNVERSNEPIKGGFAELQNFQQHVLSSRVHKRKEKPKTHGEFKKNEHGSSDMYFTSHSAEGFLTQTKFTVAPTRVKGENAYDKELTTFLKLPTRHNYEKLYDLMAKGNTGTWYAKRADKGGDTAGNVIVIDHPDRSQEQIFFNDDFYAQIGKEFGEKVQILEKEISKLEEKVSRKGDKKYKEDRQKELKKAQTELNLIYDEVRPEFYNVFNANDLHFGEWSMPGRFTLSEGIRASQLAALQSMGTDSMKYSIITEAFNGAQAFRSYDAKKLGTWVSGINFREELDTLTAGLLKGGAKPEELMMYRDIFTQEMLDGIVTHKLEGQTTDFKKYEFQLFHELMNKGMETFVGMGNHHQASGKDQQSEGDIVIKALDGDGFYQSIGKIKMGHGSTAGQSFNYDMARLPGLEGTVLNAVIAHKMWSGKTEIDGPIRQMVRTKDDAVYGFAADRHHSGMAAQNGKMIFLDTGKPPVNPFVQMIGKCSSTRGTQIPRYDPTGENGYMAKREFVDPVVEKIIGWDEKANILDRSYSIIEAGMKNSGVLAKIKQMNQLTESGYLKH